MGAVRTEKLLVDGFTTKITRVGQELRVLVYPSAIDLSSTHLRDPAQHLAARCCEIGTRWRRITPGRQALLVLAHLRYGDTYAQLAAGFDIGMATVYRYIREAIEVLAALAPSLAEVGRADRKPTGLRDPRRNAPADRPDCRRHPVLLRKTQTPWHERPGPD